MVQSSVHIAIYTRTQSRPSWQDNGNKEKVYFYFSLWKKDTSLSSLLPPIADGVLVLVRIRARRRRREKKKYGGDSPLDSPPEKREREKSSVGEAGGTICYFGVP